MLQISAHLGAQLGFCNSSPRKELELLLIRVAGSDEHACSFLGACLCTEMFPGGYLGLGTGPDSCLCLCAKCQFRLAGLLGVPG